MVLDVMDEVKDLENMRKAIRKNCCGGCEGAVVFYEDTVIVVKVLWS